MDKDEAIKILKKQVINEPCHCEHCNKNREACNLLIDYIEELHYKLQEHIETHRQIKQCYISKDKIRNLIKNNEEDIDYSVHDIIDDLRKLLEEDNNE